MGIPGQDWSSYQSAAPDTWGLSFAFVKVTEGSSYVNPNWTAQRDHAKAGGLVWGGYHYPHMGNSVQVEADFFLSRVAWQPGDMVCLDWEGYDAANSGVSSAARVAYKDAWLAYVKSKLPHNPVGMYCNVDYWNNVDTSGHYGDFLWIATAGRAAGDPGISAPWLFHQYSDSPVDSDYCRLGSTDELRSWAMSFAQQTPPEDVVTPQDKQDIAQATSATLMAAMKSDPEWRDTVTFSGLWWLEYVLKGEVPVGANAAWADMVNNAHVQLGAFIEARVAAALQSNTVQVHVDVTQPAAPAAK